MGGTPSRSGRGVRRVCLARVRPVGVRQRVGMSRLGVGWRGSLLRRGVSGWMVGGSGSSCSVGVVGAVGLGEVDGLDG